MLKRLDNSDVGAAVSYLFGGSAVSVRIRANLSVYKTDYPFAEFWAQYDENGKITAVMSKISGSCTLEFSDNADKAELCALLGFIPCNSVFLEKEKARLLGFENFTSGDILCAEEALEIPLEKTDAFADMKEAFALISESEGASVTKLDYLEWLSDFTFKSNRQAARLRALTLSAGLVSFAMTSAETENAGIISGVFTKKEYRSRGFGERVLKSLTQSLIGENKKVYIMTAENIMTKYYEKRGFKKVGCWAEVKF